MLFFKKLFNRLFKTEETVQKMEDSAKALNEEMSMPLIPTAEITYQVVVVGTYICQDEKGKNLKPYKFTIGLSKKEGALSTIKNQILDVVLPVLYKDYSTFYTYNIDSIEPFAYVSRIAYMGDDDGEKENNMGC